VFSKEEDKPAERPKKTGWERGTGEWGKEALWGGKAPDKGMTSLIMAVGRWV